MLNAGNKKSLSNERNFYIIKIFFILEQQNESQLSTMALVMSSKVFVTFQCTRHFAKQQER